MENNPEKVINANDVELSFVFNLNEVNSILKGLGNLSYVEVKDLVEKIRQAANEQMSNL